MDPLLAEWLNLIGRWTHVITGIAWIGSSFYFNWLDSHLEKPRPPRPGVEGEVWLVHSGGFYQVEKIHVAPEAMPEKLHWFKWEAAFTWISGVFLLTLIYYLEAGVQLVDPAVAALDPLAAIGIGVGTLVVGWLVYDGIWRSAGAETNPGLAVVLSLGLLALVTWGLCQVLSGRGAYMHVGAMIGTIMVANVWAIIIPAQNALVAATKAGRRPDPALGLKAKQRSLHNNYLTLPVVFVMLSGHYPGTFGHHLNWLVLLALTATGMFVRHIFNLRNKGRDVTPAAFGAVASAMVFAAVAMLPAPGATNLAAGGPPVAFAQLRGVIEGRCTSCHSAQPADRAYARAPLGVAFDTPDEIQRHAQKINARAVVTRGMPLANKTGMTAEERDLVGRWVAQGAKIE